MTLTPMIAVWLSPTRSVVLALLLSACGAAPSSVATPSQATPTAEPTRAAPPAKHGLRPCLMDDPSACGTAPSADEPPALEADKRYSVSVDAGDPIWGPKNAKVTVVVFSDYECPYCKHLKPTLQKLREEYPDTLRIVWKDMPLPMHPHAGSAAKLGRTAYAVGGDSLFWKTNQLIYDRQDELDEAVLAKLAKELGLPWPPSADLDQHLNKDWDQVETLNVRSTPTSFVNGRPIFGAKGYEVFEELVEAELKN